MELKKHNTELAQRMHLLDESSDMTLARELIELHEEKCRECQEDRLRCATNPACKNRNFLNALIEIGVEPHDLPSFCYSQYLNQVRRFVLEGKGLGHVDRRLPIKDLLSTLKVSSIRHFRTKFSKIWKKSSVSQAADIMLVSGDGLLFKFDFSRGIATLNPVHDVITGLEEFILYVNLFARYYDLTVEVKDLTSNWWLLVFDVTGIEEAEVRSLAKSKVAREFEAVYLAEEDGNKKLHIELISKGQYSTLESGHLRELFEKIEKMKG
ncbi:MAG: hypothetical protein ACP6KW_07575 [Candidatus Thorarchaeota archaeon]